MKLLKPITAHGQEITDLTFREPNGDDLATSGFPLITENNGMATRSVIDAMAMTHMIARLAGIPPSSVKMMSALDWTRAMGEVMGFFADMATQGTA